MRYEFDGMYSIYLQSAPSIQHLCTPLFSLTLFRHPLVMPCCVVLCLASFLSAFSLEHICSVSYIPSEALLKMHISYDITTCDFPPLWYHCRPYDSLYLHSFPFFLHLIWKWQCYLQSLSSGFGDRENGGGDHIGLGHGVWRMIGCACIWLHLQNLICSQCRESPDKPVKASGGGKMQRMGQRCGNGKNWWTEKMEEKERQRMTPDGDGRE